MTNHHETPAHFSSVSLLTKVLFAAAMALLTTACAGFDLDVEIGDGVDGSGVAETKRIDVDITKVTKVEVSDVWDVEVKVGDETGVEVTTDDNLFESAKVTVDGTTLKLSTKGSFNDSLGMKAVVTVTDLTELVVRDVSKVTIDSVTVGDLRVEVRDSSSASIAGTVSSLDLEVRDVSEVDGQNLIADTVTVEARDMADIEVSVTGEITGSATDVSSITVFGEGDMSVTTRDLASVERG